MKKLFSKAFCVGALASLVGMTQLSAMYMDNYCALAGISYHKNQESCQTKKIPLHNKKIVDNGRYTHINKKCLTDGSTYLQFCKKDIVIAAACYSCQDHWFCKSDCLLESFWVHPDFRNKGIGKSIFPIIMQEIAGDFPDIDEAHWIVYPTEAIRGQVSTFKERLGKFYQRNGAVICKLPAEEWTARYDLKQLKAQLLEPIQ